jgi:hypothetical protein
LASTSTWQDGLVIIASGWTAMCLRPGVAWVGSVIWSGRKVMSACSISVMSAPRAVSVPGAAASTAPRNPRRGMKSKAVNTSAVSTFSSFPAAGAVLANPRPLLETLGL